jgi:hypothetical protein
MAVLIALIASSKENSTYCKIGGASEKRNAKSAVVMSWP